MTAADLLRAWFAATGWGLQSLPDWADPGAEWFAYRPTIHPARQCECNGKRPLQVVATLHEIHVNGDDLSKVEVKVCGEVGGRWFALAAHGISLDECPAALLEAERSLIAAWNGITGWEPTR